MFITCINILFLRRLFVLAIASVMKLISNGNFTHTTHRKTQVIHALTRTAAWNSLQQTDRCVYFRVLFIFYGRWILFNPSKLFKILRSHLKIPGAGRVTRNTFHTQGHGTPASNPSGHFMCHQFWHSAHRACLCILYYTTNSNHWLFLNRDEVFTARYETAVQIKHCVLSFNGLKIVSTTYGTCLLRFLACFIFSFSFF
jgi:hypothetical protein